MATLIEIQTDQGTTRRCDSICHNADPKGVCTCICGGAFHGKRDAEVPWEEVARVRESIVLRRGEQVQLRVGA